VDRLQPFIGKDLRTLSEAEQIKFDNIIGRLIPQARVFDYATMPRALDLSDWRDYLTAKPVAKRYPFFDQKSWYLWKVHGGQGETRLILFQGRNSFVIPGGSGARIFVTDTKGNLLTESNFSTGWRIDIHDARWLEDGGHGFPCLVVSSSPCMGGGNMDSQYYALLDDTLALVRLEDSTGKIDSADYRYPNHTIGPSVPTRTAEKWEAALHSPEASEVLRTLVWLGGDHLDLPVRDGEHVYVGALENAFLVRTVRARPSVRTAVETLTRCEDIWVKEAAQQAWKVMTDPDK
jgi:hypothetical protein